MAKPPILLVAFFFCINLIYAQDISGIWVGNYGKSLSIAAVNRLEVELVWVNDTLVSGQSRLYHGRNEYEVYKVKGVYRTKDSTIFFSEQEEVEINVKGSNVPGHYTMQLSVMDTTMRLEGRWQQHGSGYGLMNTSVWLEKKIVSEKQKITTATKPIEDVKTKPIQEEKKNKELSRSSKIIKIIEIDSTDADSITIEIVDNAKLDHDIISLYINDELVFDHKEISYSPLTHYLSIPVGKPECTIKMVANSCGAMPPCTARMNIITPRTTFPVTMESNYSTNGVVVLKLKL